MSKPIKSIRNNITGHEFKFLRTAQDNGEEILEMEVTYPINSKRPPMHYHPLQREHFQILSGEMTVMIDGRIRTLKPGDDLDVKPNQRHAMWNDGERPTVMRWTVTPALHTEQFFDTLALLANTGQTDKDGTPNLLQASRTMLHFSKEFRLSKPPFIVQQLVFRLLSPIARLLGYRAVHAQG